METAAGWSARPAHVRELPVVAGNLALDFANTVDDPGGPAEWDHVADYRSLLDWSVRLDTLGDDDAHALEVRAAQHPGGAAEVVQRAAGLRAALGSTFGALVEGRAPGDGWRSLRPFVTEALERAELADARPPVLAWPAADLAAPLWPVAEAAYRLLHAPELRRLKRCAGCPWLFLDASKNGSRRWCSMTDCGTHEKIQRYVARRAARRVAGSVAGREG